MTLKEMSLHKAADLTDDMKWDLAYVPLLTGESDAPLLELIDREQNRKRQIIQKADHTGELKNHEQLERRRQDRANWHNGRNL